jgi:CBS domain-containing protein
MAKQVHELMSSPPIKLQSSAPIIEAARQMRTANIGTVIVEDGKGPCGIVTDRDIAVRAVAEGKDPANTPLSEICSKDLTTLFAEDDLDQAVELMRERAIRRVLVVDAQKRPVGVLSLGDLAVERDSRSVLGQISSAPPNH